MRRSASTTRFTGRSPGRGRRVSIGSRTSPALKRSCAVAADLVHPDFPTLCGHLNARGVDYLVLGGWAAIAHGLSRTTLDVDLWVRPTEGNVSKLLLALSEIGFGIAKELTPQHILSRQAFLCADQIRIDIFTRPWNLEDFDASRSRAMTAEFESVKISFLSIDDLIASKKTGRPQDQADVEALTLLRNRKPPDAAKTDA